MAGFVVRYPTEEEMIQQGFVSTSDIQLMADGVSDIFRTRFWLRASGFLYLPSQHSVYAFIQRSCEHK